MSSDARFIHILFGNEHFGPSMLISHLNELGYSLSVLNKIRGMSLFSKIYNLVFDSKSGHLEGDFRDKVDCWKYRNFDLVLPSTFGLYSFVLDSSLRPNW